MVCQLGCHVQKVAIACHFMVSRPRLDQVAHAIQLVPRAGMNVFEALILAPDGKEGVEIAIGLLGSDEPVGKRRRSGLHAAITDEAGGA